MSAGSNRRAQVVPDYPAALEDIVIEWQELPPITDAGAALHPSAIPVHPGLHNNLAITRTRDPITNYGAYNGNLKTLDPAEIGDIGQ